MHAANIICCGLTMGAESSTPVNCSMTVLALIISTLIRASREDLEASTSAKSGISDMCTCLSKFGRLLGILDTQRTSVANNATAGVQWLQSFIMETRFSYVLGLMPVVPPISPAMSGFSILVALNKCRLRSGMANAGAASGLWLWSLWLILVRVCYGPVIYRRSLGVPGGLGPGTIIDLFLQVDFMELSTLFI